VVYAAVELGGMSIRAAISVDSTENIVSRELFRHGEGSGNTETPAETCARVVAWLTEQRKKYPFVSLGIASFGPIDPREGSPTFGQITSTPKIPWRGFNVYNALNKFNCPTAFDTDVNAPAMYEFAAATAKDPGMSSCAYITVGTGIGIGLVVNGKPVHGMLHPEAGHMPYPKYSPEDPFNGLDGWTIPQGIEANASALALQRRAGLDSPDDLVGLPDDHEVWKACAHYVAGACVNVALLASAEKIVIGGGVLNRKCLFPMIRAKVQEVLNGYIDHKSITTQAGIDSYIVPGVMGNDAGIVGALALAEMAYADAAPAAATATATAGSSGTACCKEVAALEAEVAALKSSNTTFVGLFLVAAAAAATSLLKK